MRISDLSSDVCSSDLKKGEGQSRRWTGGTGRNRPARSRKADGRKDWADAGTDHDRPANPQRQSGDVVRLANVRRTTQARHCRQHSNAGGKSKEDGVGKESAGTCRLRGQRETKKKQ